MHNIVLKPLHKLLALMLLGIAVFGVLSQSSAPSTAVAAQSIDEQAPASEFMMAGQTGRNPWGI